MYICTKCKIPKEIKEFTNRPERPIGHHSHCNSCRAEDKRKERQFNREIVFNHYGNKCVCCGESISKFLTLDHIDNDGALHRKSEKLTFTNQLHRWIITHNFPSNFQVLCFNCNCGRAHNKGICPHKELSRVKAL